LLVRDDLRDRVGRPQHPEKSVHADAPMPHLVGNDFRFALSRVSPREYRCNTQKESENLPILGGPFWAKEC
jgi:hypothetical protein